MDFEDSGIESDPKVNSDSDTLNQNEPIISFSPERCRFDSGQSSSRKSSTTFPISVTDLQLDDSGLEQLANATYNSITLQNSATAVPKNASSIHHHNSILTQQHHHHHHPHHPPLLANVHKPAYSFLPQTQLHSTTSASIHTFSSTSALTSSSSGPVISTHSTATLSSAATTKNSSISLVSSSSSGGFSTEGNSAPLMVNGAILSTTSDLQKRLEKRIAQATSTTSTTSSSPTPISTPPLSSLASDSSDSKLTKHSNDSLRSDLAANGNQISFSPDKAYTSASTSSTLNFLDSGSEVDLWEREVVKDGKTKIISDHDVMLTNLEGEKEASQISIMDELMMNSDKSSAVAVSTSLSSSARGGESTTASKLDGMEESRGKLVLTTTPSCPSVKTSDTHTTTTSGGDGGGGSSSGTNVSETSGGGTANSNNIPKHKSLRNNTTPPSGPPPVTNSSTLPTASVITVNSGFDMRKVCALLPPQRLAIPSKPNPQLQSSSSHKGKFPSTSLSSTPSGQTFSTSSPFANGGSGNTSTASTTTTTSSLNLSSSAAVHKMSRNASISETSCNNAVSTCPPVTSGNGNVRVGSNSSKLSSEKKPLVQWDSDESEEELSFFPPSKRGVITDNLSIDNMSLSGEEEDLHLTPPRPLAKRCPCDPRCWLERHELHSSHHHHHHGDVTHTVSSRPCVIS